MTVANLDSIQGKHSQPKAHISGVFAGGFLALWCAVTGLSTLVWAPLNVELNVLVMVVMPFIIGFWLTRNFTDALLLVWVNEIFFGGNGHWLEIGPVSGRWLLLSGLILFGIIQRAREASSGAARPKFGRVIVFYGIWFPLSLVLYSAGILGNSFWKALGDVNYLYALLIYFPMRSFLSRSYFLFQGWFFGVVLIISMISLYLAFAPYAAGLPLYWAIAGESIVGTTSSGITRAAFLSQVLLFTGWFIGLFFLGDPSQPGKSRLAGLGFAGISVAPLILLFLRGPIMGLLIVMAFFVLASLYSRTVIIAKWFVFLGLAAFFSTYLLYIRIIPEAIERFTLVDADYAAYVSAERVEQAGLMLDLFSEKPLLGQGVGVPVIIAGQERFEFELQYNMLLYRVGIINMIVLLFPVAWFFRDLFFILRVRGRLVRQIKVKIVIAVLLSLLTILIAGAMNPYLIAVFTPFLIVIYLAQRELVLAPV